MMNKKYTYKYKIVYTESKLTNYYYYKYNSKTKYWQEKGTNPKYESNVFKEVYNSKGLYHNNDMEKTPYILPKYIKKGAKWSYAYYSAGGTIEEHFEIPSLKGKIGKYKNCVIVKNTSYPNSGKAVRKYNYMYYAKGVGLIYQKYNDGKITLVSLNK